VITRAEFWGGLFWLALGAFITWQGTLLELGKLSEPGSGFALFWVGIFMMLLSLPGLAASVRGVGPTVGALWAGTRWLKVLVVVALLVAYALAFEPVGFLVCTAALLLTLMTLVDPVDWRAAVPISLLIPGGLWWVITKTLKIQLPSGVLAPWTG